MNVIDKVIIKNGVDADVEKTINLNTGQVTEINAILATISTGRGVASYNINSGKPQFVWSGVGDNEMWIYIDGIGIKVSGIITTEQGPQGEQGEPGADGEQGPQGIQGETGVGYDFTLRNLALRTESFVDIDKVDYLDGYPIEIYITGSAQKIYTADPTLELKRELRIINQTNVSGLGILPQLNLPSGHTFLKGGVAFKTVPLDGCLTAVRIGATSWIYY